MDDKPVHVLSKLGFLSESRRFSWYPPFWLMRPKILEHNAHWTHVRIKLPLTWASKNAAGYMFGGYQANLADPVPAIACVKLFPGYRVATKHLALDFLRVGNSDLILHFDVSEAQITGIQQELAKHQRATPCFEMYYKRADGKVCTLIRNTIAIRPVGYIGRYE